MNVGCSTNQCSALPPLAPGDNVGSELNGRDVKLVNSCENDMQQFLRRVSSHTIWFPSILSNREVEFASPINPNQRLFQQIIFHPLDRRLTSDNKEPPCNLATPSIAISEVVSPWLSAARMSELKAIRVTTEKYGGEVVFEFSQLNGAFKEQMIMHADTREGACKALCDHWMACHANGLNLFDGLYVNGKKGQFNNAMLASIKQSTIDTFGRGLENQLNASDDWLAKNGLELFETSVNTAKRTLPRCIIDRGCYTAILFCQRRSGHVVVTYTAGNGEIRFFDPNFGDFKFPTYSAFKAWFEVDFLPLSTYKYEEMRTMSYTTRHAFLLQTLAGAHFPGAC